MIFLAILAGGVGLPLGVGFGAVQIGNIVAKSMSVGIAKETAEIAEFRAAQVTAPWPVLEAKISRQLDKGDGSHMLPTTLPLGAGKWEVSHAEYGMMARVVGSGGVMTPDGISAIRVVRDRARARTVALATAIAAVEAKRRA